MSGDAASLLKEARTHIGEHGRPNAATRWYASKFGPAFLNAAWCDMWVSYIANETGNLKNIGGPFAYTVAHAQRFKDMGRWHSDSDLKVGDIVFFDWDGTDSISRIDHVGIVEKVLSGGRVQTIEGNTADSVARRVRARSSIVGGGRPTFASKPTAPSRPMLRKGSTGTAVKTLQKALIAKGYKLPRYGVDGDFGAETLAAVKRFQKAQKITVDGVVGPVTWGRLL